MVVLESAHPKIAGFGQAEKHVSGEGESLSVCGQVGSSTAQTWHSEFLISSLDLRVCLSSYREKKKNPKSWRRWSRKKHFSSRFHSQIAIELSNLKGFI